VELIVRISGLGGEMLTIIERDCVNFVFEVFDSQKGNYIEVNAFHARSKLREFALEIIDFCNKGE